jgi:ribosomal-protein-alanine N-acetyltransferase
MEKMPYRDGGELETVVSTIPLRTPTPAVNDWRTGLPTLSGSLVTLRALRAADAPSLFVSLTAKEVARFISPPPTSVEGFERFIAWADRQRAAGHYICLAVATRSSDIAIGLFQMRSLEPDFGTAEWGFAVAYEFWGTGVFVEAANLLLDFAFGAVGSHRLEARAATVNGRGNGALRKLGARREGILRKSFLRRGEYLDQALWTILREDWLEAKATWGATIIH